MFSTACPNERLPEARLRAIGSGDSPGVQGVLTKGFAMKVRVSVSLKNGVLDPQGRAIKHSLEGLGFDGVKDVRAGRLIELEVDESVSDADLDEMCKKLLANMVIENYRIERVAG
jgi:phosphoribosylformylglycinamidine synthase PurS subunit